MLHCAVLGRILFQPSNHLTDQMAPTNADPAGRKLIKQLDYTLRKQLVGQIVVFAIFGKNAALYMEFPAKMIQRARGLLSRLVDDDFNTSDQIEVAVNLIDNLCSTYSIDTNRLYTTGQSMGGMTSFYLNVAYPDLFAASLFVGSQWNNEILDVLEEDKFFYIVSAGDDKAYTGQTGLMEVFDEDGVPYTHEEWSVQEDEETQNASVEAMIQEGLNANFITFTKGTTVEGGASGSEHLTSFDYAYKLEAVRDWLFEQSK